MTDFSHIRGIIWDLDGTLYRYNQIFLHACNLAAARTVLDLGLDMTFEDAVALAAESEKQHGNSFRLFADHGIKYEDFHLPFHKSVDTTILQKNQEMKDALDSLKLPMVILTNASREWAIKTMQHLEIFDLFGEGRILALEDANFEAKAYSTKGFQRALDIMNLKAAEVLMVEDLARNLIQAKGLGLTTALVHHQKIPDDAVAHVDCFFANTIDLVETLIAAKS